MAYQGIDVIARYQGVPGPLLDTDAQAFGVALTLDHVGTPAHRIADDCGQGLLISRDSVLLRGRRSLGVHPERPQYEDHYHHHNCPEIDRWFHLGSPLSCLP